MCVSIDECLEVEQKEKECVYLMDPFEGRAFHHLTALGCRYSIIAMAEVILFFKRLLPTLACLKIDL